MKSCIKILTVIIVATSTNSFSQNIGINSSGATPNLSAMLDITSGASGTLGLLIPRMTYAQRTGIVTLPAAAQGLIVYQTNSSGSSSEGFYYNTSTTITPTWSYLTAGGWQLTGNAATASPSSGIGTAINNNFLGTTDAVDLAFATNGYERMRIKSDANGNSIRIGIGTAFTTNLNTGTSPSLFHLHSPSDLAELNLTTGLTAIGSRAATINFAATGVTNERRTSSIESYLTNYSGGNATGDLRFFTNNANTYSEKMRIQGDGNIGMGTTAPVYRLDLANGTFGFGNSNQRTESRDNAGLQGNAGAQSGFFETAAPVNYPSGASSWWHLIDVRHSNTGNNYALQIAGSFFDQNLYFRKTNNSASTPWSQILTTSSTFTQGISMTSTTTESIIAGNNTGSYSLAPGAGYTTGTFITVPGTAVTRTITSGNNVQVTFSARWETDDYNYYTPEMIWFRILRDGTPIATTSVFTDGGSYWYFTDGNVTLNVQDAAVTAGAHTYSVDCWLTNATGATEAFFIGERYLTVTEIKP